MDGMQSLSMGIRALGLKWEPHNVRNVNNRTSDEEQLTQRGIRVL